MRVIAGSARGRRLTPPADRSVRPTADRVKEALFSIVTSRMGSLDGASVLDLCAGSGSLGIEALSRGAGRVVFCDDSPSAVRLITHNLGLTGFSDRGVVIRSGVLELIPLLAARGERFDLILADPPYASGLASTIPGMILSHDLLSPSGIIVIEHDARSDLPSLDDDGIVYSRRTYGTTSLSIYERIDPT